MNPPIDFEMREGYAFYRPSGTVTFNEGVAMVSRAIAQATGQDIPRLLVDTVNLTGFPHPNTVERYFMGEQWAAHARGLVLSLVAREELLDPFRFGVTVARNRGLMCDVFVTEPEAVAWLMDSEGK